MKNKIHIKSTITRKNQIIKINIFAIQVMTCSKFFFYSKLNVSKKKKKIHTKIRKQLICHRLRHKRAAIEHLYIKREKKSEKNLMQQELTSKKSL